MWNTVAVCAFVLLLGHEFLVWHQPDKTFIFKNILLGTYIRGDRASKNQTNYPKKITDLWCIV